MTLPRPAPATLDRGRALAPLVIRAFVGAVLVWGTADNVLHHARILEFLSYPKSLQVVDFVALGEGVCSLGNSPAGGAR